MLPVSHKYLVASGQEVRRGLPDCAACLLPPSWDYCPDLSGNSSQRWRQLDQLLRAGGRDCESPALYHCGLARIFHGTVWHFAFL